MRWINEGIDEWILRHAMKKDIRLNGQNRISRNANRKLCGANKVRRKTTIGTYWLGRSLSLLSKPSLGHASFQNWVWKNGFGILTTEHANLYIPFDSPVNRLLCDAVAKMHPCNTLVFVAEHRETVTALWLTLPWPKSIW